ncbi:hypothetical protein EDC94DRAFT_645925 [Helicostylum pulchrum]|nr:hypothetical protein EDC94DRAFT_645925 [Helicostylum pulchrum]
MCLCLLLLLLLHVFIFFMSFYPSGWPPSYSIIFFLWSFILVVFYPCKFFFLVVEALWCICYDISVGAWITFGTLALVYFVLLSCSGVSYMIDIYTRFFAQAKESGAWSTLTVELIVVFKDDLESKASYVKETS